MSHQDAGLYKSFAIVLGALVAFTLFCIVIANMFSPATDHSADPLIASSVKKLIEPVGRSNVSPEEEVKEGQTETSSSAPEATPEPVPAAEVAEPDSGQSEEAATATTESVSESNTDAAAVDATSSTAAAPTEDSENKQTEDQRADAEPASVNNDVDISMKVRAVVATNCAGCHQNGVMGAQRNDDSSAWQALADKGLEALTASVVNGRGEMPARAESTLDDAEIELAVQHMINKNLAGVGADTSTEDSDAGTTNSESSSAASAPAESTEANAESTQADIVSDASAASDSTDAAAEAIPANVKATVDGVCAACHISGVGNAPKFGDKEAWTARMANGIDASTAIAIAGKGAMPARGGSQLTDEEIKLAIQYMISK